MSKLEDEDVFIMENLIQNIELDRTPHPGSDKYRYRMTFFLNGLSEYEIEKTTRLKGVVLVSCILGLACHKMRKLLENERKWGDE